MLKAILVILAISSIAICVEQVQNPYENPWNKDGTDPSCKKGEQLETIKDDDNVIIAAQCMLLKPWGDYSQCAPPPNFRDTKLAAYPTWFGPHHDTDRACVVECSEDKTNCPEGSYCLPASHNLQKGSDMVHNICYYGAKTCPDGYKLINGECIKNCQPGYTLGADNKCKSICDLRTEYWNDELKVCVTIARRNNYENPFFANPSKPECDQSEKKLYTKDLAYAQCMPILFEGKSDCPKLPHFMEESGLKANATKITDNNEEGNFCTVECTNSKDNACQAGRCVTAAEAGLVANDKVNNVCVYEKPAQVVRQEVKVLRQRINNFQANFHYEDPFWASHKPYCTGTREEPMGYDGLDDYYGCMPLTFGRENKCYQDYPNGTTATPMPIYNDETDPQNPVARCALVCSGAATGICGPRAECMILPGMAQAQVGVCLYKKK